METVVLTFVYCTVSRAFVFVCFFSDKFHVQLLYDRICGPTKWYVCMYVDVWNHCGRKRSLPKSNRPNYRGVHITGHQIAWAKILRTVATKICWCSVLNLLHVTLMPQVLSWPLDFWKICAPLPYYLGMSRIIQKKSEKNPVMTGDYRVVISSWNHPKVTQVSIEYFVKTRFEYGVLNVINYWVQDLLWNDFKQTLLKPAISPSEIFKKY
jgi:hypothetical protein